MANDFFDHRINERVGVVIVAAEGYGILSNRVAATKAHFRISDRLPIAFFSFGGDLKKAADLAALIDLLSLISYQFETAFGVRLGLVIIDTVAAAFGMDDENSNAEAARIIRALRELVSATGALIMPVHHYGKSHETGLRGASGFRAGADTIISIMAKRDDPTGRVGDRSVALAKSRTGKEGHISSFDLVHVPLGIDRDGDMFGDAVAVPNLTHAPSGGGRKLPASANDLRAAFATAIDAEGVHQPDITGQSDALSVRVKIVQAEFARLRRKPGDDAKKSADASRNTFKTALASLSHEFAVGQDSHGVEWLWRRANGNSEAVEVS